MAEKSKEQLKVEEYFKQNGIEYDKNCIYGIKRERNLNSFLMMGLIGLLMKTGMKPCYILFNENVILFFAVGMLGGIKEFLTRIDVEDIEKIDLKKGILNYIEEITGYRPSFEMVDLRDKEATEEVFKKYSNIVGIIHFAASKAVGESVQKPLLYYRNNIVSLINLLELMPEYGVKGIIFSSSCTVYGQPKPENLPVTEDAPHQKATSPYGNTKEINEQIIYDYIHSGADIKSIILRYFNPIGAHPTALIGELPNGVPANLIPYVTQTAIGIRKELTIFGNDYDTPDGTCIRDYIYVVDLAKAHVAAMRRVLEKDADRIDYFNIGTGHGNTTKEIVDTFEEATGVKVNWHYGPRREGDIEKIWGDCSKANKELGWKADTPLTEVLASAWKWQKKLREDGVM